MIINPILPGFNPDPSICRVGDDYYIATSTFEWYPGVQIHHSRDLANWDLVTRPLNRASQLDMRGNPDSCGVWAPCLSYADGLFWLVYTDVKRFEGSFKDAHNYIVTAPSIEGPWSDPIYVNSSGFDPSLFHDDDGRKWFTNMQWNHRPEARNTIGHAKFDGILLQEWDPKTQKLTGPIKNIFEGSKQGLVEGPHLFKRNGWYYLTTAEGGTGYDHVVTMARSRSIDGPYEMHPNTHLITSKDNPEAVLQRAGHGQYVETPEGDVYHTHLCGRPMAPKRRCTLGRETGLQKCVWKEDDWLYLEQGGVVPAVEVPALAGAVKREESVEIVRHFDSPDLPKEFQWLRTPQPERLFSLTERAGHLRLFGRESIGSWFEQSLVARRQEHHRFRTWRRLDRLLAVGAGHADLEIPQRHSGRHARNAGQVARPWFPQRAQSRKHPGLEPHRREARPDTGANGARLGAARRPHHHGADRGIQALAGRGLRQGDRDARFHGRRTRRNRRVCQGRRHQHLGSVRRAQGPTAEEEERLKMALIRLPPPSPRKRGEGHCGDRLRLLPACGEKVPAGG